MDDAQIELSSVTSPQVGALPAEAPSVQVAEQIDGERLLTSMSGLAGQAPALDCTYSIPPV